MTYEETVELFRDNGFNVHYMGELVIDGFEMFTGAPNYAKFVPKDPESCSFYIKRSELKKLARRPKVGETSYIIADCLDYFTIQAMVDGQGNFYSIKELTEQKTKILSQALWKLHPNYSGSEQLAPEQIANMVVAENPRPVKKPRVPRKKKKQLDKLYQKTGAFAAGCNHKILSGTHHK